MKKILLALSLVLLFGLSGCSTNNNSVKTSSSVTTERKNKEETNKKNQELVQTISSLKKTLVSMEDIQKQTEDFAKSNTDEDIQGQLDEAVSIGLEQIDDLNTQIAKAEDELKTLK